MKSYLVTVETTGGDSVVAGRQSCESVHVPQEDRLVQPCTSHLLSVLGIGERLHIVLVRPQCGHAEPLVGVPHLDRGVAAGGDDVLAPAAEDNVVDPVSVVFHGLEVRLLVLNIPDPDDAVPACTVQPLEVVVVLEGVDPGPVAPLALLADDEGDLNLPTGCHHGLTGDSHDITVRGTLSAGPAEQWSCTVLYCITTPQLSPGNALLKFV